MSGKKKFSKEQVTSLKAEEDENIKDDLAEEKVNDVGSPVVTPSPLETIFEDAVLTPDSCSVGQDAADMPKDFSALRDEIKKDQKTLMERSESTEEQVHSQESSAGSNINPLVEKSMFKLNDGEVVKEECMLSGSSLIKENETENETENNWNISKQISPDSNSGKSNSSSSKINSNDGKYLTVLDKSSSIDKSGKTDEVNQGRIVLKINLNESKSQRMKKFEDGTYIEANSTTECLFKERLVGEDVAEDEESKDESMECSDERADTEVCHSDSGPTTCSESRSSESNIGKGSQNESGSQTPYTSEGESSCCSRQSWTRYFRNY